MSRIGKLPVVLPNEVVAQIAGNQVVVRGPKGELKLTLPMSVQVKQADQALQVSVLNPDQKSDRALWGLHQRLLTNMVKGVSEGFEKRLEVNGIGYQAVVKGEKLTLLVGYSHPVEFPIPPGVTIVVEKNVIKISGNDKQLIGETAARIRKIRPPEPYKGKGIKYVDEIIRRKAGKQAKTAGAK